MLKDSIKKYCEELAKSDVEFANHYDVAKIGACCNYITNQARKIIKSGCGFIEDPVVYKWARDFFYGDTEEPATNQTETSDNEEETLEEEEIETKPATVITAKKEKKSDEQYQMSLF